MISNAQFVNITSGEARLTAFAQNAAGKVSIFSLPFSVPTGGLQLTLDTILGRNREINDLFNKPGRFAGSTLGNEQLVEKTASITLKDDFVYLNNNVDAQSIARTKSLMRAIAMGDIFHTGSTNYKVVGTNGAIKSATGVTSGKAFGLLTALDGMLIDPQSSIIDGTDIFEVYKQNVRVSAYNKSSILLMFEVLTTFDENKSEGYRFVYNLNSNFQYSEQTDANEVSFDQLTLCDVRYIDNFFYKGLSTGESGTGIPARQLKIGTKVQSIFKSPVDVAGITNGVVAADNLTVPTKVVKTDGSVEAYTPVADDICVAYTDTKKYIILKKVDTTNWQALENNVSNTNLSKTTTTTNADATYDTYDFDFEAEGFVMLV